MRGSIVTSFLAALAGQQKPLGRLTQLPDATKEFMSCKETYGKGSETCGDRNSRFCYNPAMGQSCCEVDNGYCDKGTWCAPVAGYCCLNSEDLATCARNAGFELIGNTSVDDLAATVTLESTSSRTQPQESATSLSDPPDPETTSSTAALRSNPLPPTPYTQVSMARREDQWAPIRVALGMGVVGLFMLFC